MGDDGNELCANQHSAVSQNNGGESASFVIGSIEDQNTVQKVGDSNHS